MTETSKSAAPSSAPETRFTRRDDVHAADGEAILATTESTRTDGLPAPARPLPWWAAADDAPASTTGPSPRRAFGHSADRSRVVEAEVAAIREAARRMLAGETLSSVVQDWNRRGLTTSGGGPWRVNSRSNLLVQPRLAAPSQIVDEETHQALVALHASRRQGPRRATRRYLLTGLLRCWRCGGVLRGMPRARGADLDVCPGPPHGGCSGTAATADHAEDAVRDLVTARLDSPDLVELPPDGDGVADELAGHRRWLAELGVLWASGEISREEWLSLKRNVARRAVAAEAEAARLERLAALRRMSGAGHALRAQWPALTVDERRLIVHTVVDHVVPGRPNAPANLPPGAPPTPLAGMIPNPRE